MSQLPSHPERLDLLGADDPRDVVHRAVACLAREGVVALPTEASYALAASALAPSAVEALRALKGGAPGRKWCVAVRDPSEVADWVPDVTSEGRKLARRAWPGPLTMIVRGDVDRGLAACLPPPVRPLVAGDSSVGLRLPGHDAVREVLGLVQGPLILTDAPGPRGFARTGDDLAGLAGLAMIVDDGPIAEGARNTVIALRPDGWDVTRPGAIPESSLRALGGSILLFVCTGNTCRSPMAEALCNLLLARRLGCRPEEVASRGILVASAGIAAGPGARAAAEAMEVVEARGGSLRRHQSRQVSRPMIDAADWIVAMTGDHRDALLDEFPEAEPRVRLLHPRGGDIADPIGMDRETYRRTAESIETYLRTLLDDLGL